MKEAGMLKMGYDQMEQAARSGKQNHAYGYGVTEGCMASRACEGRLYGQAAICS